MLISNIIQRGWKLGSFCADLRGVKRTAMRIAPAAPPAPAEPVASNKSPELPSEASPDRTATSPLVPAVPAAADANVTRPLEVPAPTPEDIDREPPRPAAAPPPVKLTLPPWSLGRTPRDAPPDMSILPPRKLPAKKSHFCGKCRWVRVNRSVVQVFVLVSFFWESQWGFELLGEGVWLECRQPPCQIPQSRPRPRRCHLHAWLSRSSRRSSCLEPSCLMSTDKSKLNL